MKRSCLLRPALFGAFLFAFGGSAGASPSDAFVVDYSRSPHAVLRPLPFDAVQWTSGFWAERHRQLCDVTLNESWKLLADPEAGHVLDNFRLAARPGAGGYVGTTWQDEWVYKWIEAAACVWRQTRDPALARRMDEAIALIAAAQQPDGYLSTMPIVAGKPRFQNANDHEIYNMGHLLTAAVVHHRWKPGDTITLSLPMDAQLMTADPRVEETRNQVAVMRGPVVYCVESPDLPSGVSVPSVFLPHDAKFKPVTGVRGLDGELARSTVILRGPGRHRPESGTASLYRPLSREPLQPFDLTLVPYYAWANRGRSAMSIWLPVAIQP